MLNLHLRIQKTVTKVRNNKQNFFFVLLLLHDIIEIKFLDFGVGTTVEIEDENNVLTDPNFQFTEETVAETSSGIFSNENIN